MSMTHQEQEAGLLVDNGQMIQEDKRGAITNMWLNRLSKFLWVFIQKHHEDFLGVWATRKANILPCYAFQDLTSSPHKKLINAYLFPSVTGRTSCRWEPEKTMAPPSGGQYSSVPNSGNTRVPPW